MPRLRGVRTTVIVLSAAALLAAIVFSALIHVDPIVEVITFLPGAPGLYMAWVTWRDGGDTAGADLGKVADELAGSVLRQWNAEMRARALNDSENLPVAWEPAAPDLVESRNYLTLAALAGPGDGRRAPTWARRPRKVSGSGHGLAAVLQRVPNRRLIVLGEKGSGKTVLLIRLALDLLNDRQAGDPVPVILPLASWDPTRELSEWVISRLTLDYPGLKIQVKSSTRTCSLAEALLDKHILLILDGLDEIPEEHRGTALSRIGQFLPEDAGIVLSCRTGEYRSALEASRARGQVVKLRGAAGISLCPLTVNAIREYLLGDDPGSAEAKRWGPVFRVLGTDMPVAQALRTPLMAGLALVVYGPSRLGRVSNDDEPGEPGDLCDLKRFRHRTDVESHLFRAFIHVTYQSRDGGRKERWKTEDAERWLGFLAHHLQDRNNIAWWELSDESSWLVPAVVGVVCGIASGVAAGLGRHVGFGIGIGLGVGAFAGLAARVPAEHFIKGEVRPSKGIAGGLAGAIAGALIGGLAGKLGIGHAVGLSGGLAVALAIAIGVGSSTSFAGGLAGGLVGGFCSALLEGVGTGLPAGLVNGAGMGLCAAFAVRYVGHLSPPAYRVRWSPLGAACGLAIGIAIALIASRAIGWHIGLIAGATIGVLSAIPCGLLALVQRDSDKPQSLSPAGALSHDHRTFWMTAPTAGIAAAAVGLFGGGLTSVNAVKAHADLGSLISNGLGIGLAAGIIVGLGFGFYHAASGFFAITRCWLALRGMLPWRLMSFLADAHAKHGVLRQSGSVYQFRHLELLRWLAASYEERGTRHGVGIKTGRAAR
jgi:hypothetical protein